MVLGKAEDEAERAEPKAEAEFELELVPNAGCDAVEEPFRSARN